MDYEGILKRAWEVTWKHKILWLFGFFAGMSVGTSSSSRQATTNWQPSVGEFSARVDEYAGYVRQYGDLILVGIGFAILIGFLFYLVTIAARAGLIHLANEAEEGHDVHAGDGWRVGWSKLWRIFGIEFLAGLPALVPGIAITAVIWNAVSAFFALVRTETSWQLVGMGVLKAVGVAGFVLLAASVLVMIWIGVVVAIVEALAMRYAVLQDVGAVASIGRGWKDLWSGRGAFTMLMIQIGIGILVAIVASILGGLFFGLFGLVALIGSAIYGAFHHTVWTIFFRRMTGMEMSVAATPSTALAPPAMPSDV